MSKLPHEDRKALTKVGVVRIPREHIPATISLVSEISGIPRAQLMLLGSAGKQPTSGDLDLAVDVNLYDPQEVHERMLETFTGTYNKGSKIGSYAVPIGGDSENGLVQIDLMYVTNQYWAQFAYYSAGERSEFKGAIRAILLAAVAATIETPGYDAMVYDSDTLVARAGWALDNNIGLKRMYQIRNRREDNGNWCKALKKVEPQKIRYKYPDLTFNASDIFINDPDKVVHMLFGTDVSQSDVETVEDIIKLIKERFPKERADKIFEISVNRAAPLINKMKLPREIQEHV